MKWPGNATLSATCAGGAEPYLEEELRSNDLHPLIRENGVVHFSGGFPEIVKANNLLRTASRILLPLISGSVDGYDDLYRLCRTLDWATIIRPEQSLRVSGITRSRTITDSSFAAVRIKDAVTDSQRAKARKRSSVSRKDPDVGITFFVSDRQAHISLDSSGRPLHERGYRGVDLTDATLNPVTRFKSQLGGDLVHSLEVAAPTSRRYRVTSIFRAAVYGARRRLGRAARSVLGTDSSTGAST